MREEIEGYLEQTDWRTKENANQIHSMSGMKHQVAGKAVAKYTLDMLNDDVAFAHKNHLMHIHDMSGGLECYCAGWSLKDFIKDGLSIGYRLPTSSAPSHFDTFMGIVTQFTFIIANEMTGAAAFSDIDCYAAPFIREDNLTYKQVKQIMQSFIFTLAMPYRSGYQAPFSNISCALTPPSDLAVENVIVGGKELSYTYADCQKEMDMFNKAFCEVMSEGDAIGRPFTFPIPTYNMTKDFDWNSDIAKSIFELASKSGIPYFSNFVNSSLDPTDIRSLCCRLRLDTSELTNSGGGLFGAGEKTGSIGVVTMNMPRLAFMANNPHNDDVTSLIKEMDYTTQKAYYDTDYAKERFKILLRYTSNLGKKSLVAKRAIIEKNLKDGLFPFTASLLEDFSNHFNTIGVVGMHEALLNLGFDEGIVSKDGKKFAEEMMDFQLDLLREYQEEYKTYYNYGDFTKGLLFNYESTPAESTMYKLALYDKEYFGDKIATAIGNDGETPYYTNSTWIPQDHEMNKDIFSILDHQDSLQEKYTSGTVIHLYTEGELTWKKARDIVKKACENYKLPYISLSPTVTICPIHGRLDKEYDFCPYEHTEEEIKLIKRMGGVVITESQTGDANA